MIPLSHWYSQIAFYDIHNESVQLSFFDCDIPTLKPKKKTQFSKYMFY